MARPLGTAAPRADGVAEIRAELSRRISRRGSVKRVAFEFGVSRQFLCRIAAGKDAPSDRIAEALGFRRVIRFERVE